MLYIISADEFYKCGIKVLEKNNLDISQLNLRDALPKSFVHEFLMMYLLYRHPIKTAKILFRTLWKKTDLIVRDYNGNIVNVDEDMNINKFIFSLFVFQQINGEYIIDIDEWMLNNFYLSACRFCKINSHIIYEEDPFKKVNNDFDELIREDRNELSFIDFKDFIPISKNIDVDDYNYDNDDNYIDDVDFNNDDYIYEENEDEDNDDLYDEEESDDYELSD